MTVSRVKEFDFGTKKSEGGPVKYKQGGAVRGPGFDSDCMLKDTGTLGISRNKNPRGSTLSPQNLAHGGTARRSVPVATESPLLAMKKGGAAKVSKVMSEFKAGELHSGSKTGPVVKSRAQAVAIGMSEARKAAKR